MSEQRFRVRVLVFPRGEILDPQGKAIAAALLRLGFAEVGGVRAGKAFDLVLAAPDRAEAERGARSMCEQLLANTVVEDYEVTLAELEGE